MAYPLRRRRLRDRSRAVLLGLMVLLLVVACAPTLERSTGIVLSIDSPALGRVDSFELLDTDGQRHIFDASELKFRTEFPASHLAEHQILGDRIVVTYKEDGDRLLVTQLDDAG
jgi:hypothetical protein